MELIRLIIRHLRPYTGWVIAVVVFQFVSTLAALYLPSLNAQIIDKGVSTGDTDFIWSTGMTMLLACLVQVATAIAGIYFGARTAMAVGRDLRREIYRKVDSLGATRCRQVRNGHAHHPRHERRAAGADARADDAQLHGVDAHHVHRRNHLRPP